MVEAGVKHFGMVNLLANNEGIFYAKPFTEFIADDFNTLASGNLLGFRHIKQLAVKTDAEAEIQQCYDHYESTC